MVNPFQKGAGWAFRIRIRGEGLCRSGFKSKTQAARAMDALKAEFCSAPA